MTSAFRRFRTHTFKETFGDPDSDDAHQKTAASIKRRHKRELEQAERENRDNTSALLELRDLEDELKTILKLFHDQDVIVKNMRDLYRGEELEAYTRNALAFLDEAVARLDEYRAQTQGMLQRVD